MNFIRFVFPFLFTRNWYSGAYELSRPRIVLFLALCMLIILSVLIAAFLQTPVEYAAAV